MIVYSISLKLLNYVGKVMWIRNVLYLLLILRYFESKKVYLPFLVLFVLSLHTVPGVLLALFFLFLQTLF